MADASGSGNYWWQYRCRLRLRCCEDERSSKLAVSRAAEHYKHHGVDCEASWNSSVSEELEQCLYTPGFGDDSDSVQSSIFKVLCVDECVPAISVSGETFDHKV